MSLTPPSFQAAILSAPLLSFFIQSRNQSNGNLNDRSVAFLWARAGANSKSADSDYLRIDGNSSGIRNIVRTRGGSIRCIKDL
jgi:hypothetical protein